MEKKSFVGTAKIYDFPPKRLLVTSGPRGGAKLECFREKCEAVFPKEARQNKELGSFRDSIKIGTALVIGGLVLCTAPAANAAEELSEKSVQTFMDYAWSLVPQQFTKADGKTIIVDKKKKEEVIVPVDVAREVVRVGRLSAHAQICDLKEDQINNYNSLMRREIDKKKWTDQQLLYISQLHLTTVMLLTGKIKLVGRGDDGTEVIEEVGTTNNPTCSAEQGAKVKEIITAYVKAGPAITPAVVAAPAAATAPATTGSTTPSPAAATPAPAATATPAPAPVKPAAETK